MESRRNFLKASAAALTVAATRPLFGWQGANNRVRMAVIGMGNRGRPCVRFFSRAAAATASSSRRGSQQGRSSISG